MGTALLIFSMAIFSNADTSSLCERLAEHSPHSSIRIESAVPVGQTETLPAFCRIRGTIDPDIGFEARFPLAGWNGKYFQAGCGGFCGTIEPDRETRSNAINHALRRGYATVTTNGGHVGEHQGDGRWAKDNPVAEKVYAEQVLPLTLKAGHRLIEALYDAAPEYSYFSGCSNGGRLAGIAAQRYPDLFDGIVAGCPVLNLSINGGAFGAWVLQANADGQGGRILTHRFIPKLAMLEANALAQCDGIDGKNDGAISRPRSCRVDLDRLPACAPEGDSDAGNDCLTDEEKRVAAAWYRGPVNSQGEQVFPGMPPGSERYWGFWYLGTATYPGAGTLLADGYGTYLGFSDDPENYSALNFDFDTDVAKLAPQGELFDALDPDLAAFREAGGKMIMWHGMADPLVLPDQSRAYYETVVAEMGEAETKTFFRLFMAPGLGHCWELPAGVPDRMDLLSAIEQWVERGIAPEEIPVTQAGEDGSVIRRGTLRPYPLAAEYEANEP